MRDDETVQLKSRVVLLVGEPCASCAEAERIWHDVAAGMGVRIEVQTVDLSERAPHTGEAGVTALPALLVDGRPLVVGVPQPDRAAALLRKALAQE